MRKLALIIPRKRKEVQMPYEISKIKWFPRIKYFKVVIKTGTNSANEQVVLSKKRVALENYVAEFIADRKQNAKLYARAHGC